MILTPYVIELWCHSFWRISSYVYDKESLPGMWRLRLTTETCKGGHGPAVLRPPGSWSVDLCSNIITRLQHWKDAINPRQGVMTVDWLLKKLTRTAHRCTALCCCSTADCSLHSFSPPLFSSSLPPEYHDAGPGGGGGGGSCGGGSGGGCN